MASTAGSHPPALDVKIVLCGDMGVGKTCIVRSFVEGKFSSTNTPKPTLSGIFSTKTELVSGANVTFEIWDTAGQERYRTMQPMYYRKAKAALIVYDTTAVPSEPKCVFVFGMERQQPRVPDILALLSDVS